MMLEAIYAWRGNGGMGVAKKSERSDAIMDLRAASRNSNSTLTKFLPFFFPPPLPNPDDITGWLFLFSVYKQTLHLTRIVAKN